MFYHLLYPLVKFDSFFNIFKYITFRSIGAFVTAILLCFIFGPRIIKSLKKHHITERVNELLPQTHKKKQGTPTMGGIIIGLGLILSSLLWNNLANTYVLMAGVVTLWLGGLGFLDDYLKNVRNLEEGLIEKYKISGQIILGLLIAFILYFGYEKSNMISHISIPFFKNVSVSLGVLFIPFVAFFITFYSNAVNLTDGLDGLACGIIVLVAFGLGVMSYIKGNVIIAKYLKLEFIESAGELSVFLSAVMGSILGFLWFNARPAKIFMGDTGALSMGGLLAVLAILLKEEIFFVIISFVFFIEALSSLIQRLYFKRTRLKKGKGERVFLCAPLHHHYELKGWSENQIVIRFWILTMILTALGFATLKIR